jgi:hypothetical protein
MGSVWEKSLAGGGGHGIGDVLGTVFLLGGDVEIHPLLVLPLCPGENLKSSDWAATVF